MWRLAHVASNSQCLNVSRGSRGSAPPITPFSRGLRLGLVRRVPFARQPHHFMHELVGAPLTTTVSKVGHQQELLAFGIVAHRDVP